MSITQSKFSSPPLALDELIEYTKEAIKKQVGTIENLVAEGHEITDATKYLTQMIGNLAVLMQKKANAACTASVDSKFSDHGNNSVPARLVQ